MTKPFTLEGKLMISDQDLGEMAHALKTNPGFQVGNITMLAIVENLVLQRQKARRLEKELTKVTQLSLLPDDVVPTKRRTRSGK